MQDIVISGLAVVDRNASSGACAMAGMVGGRRLTVRFDNGALMKLASSRTTRDATERALFEKVGIVKAAIVEQLRAGFSAETADGVEVTLTALDF